MADTSAIPTTIPTGVPTRAPGIRLPTANRAVPSNPAGVPVNPAVMPSNPGVPVNHAAMYVNPGTAPVQPPTTMVQPPTVAAQTVSPPTVNQSTGAGGPPTVAANDLDRNILNLNPAKISRGSMKEGKDGYNTIQALYDNNICTFELPPIWVRGITGPEFPNPNFTLKFKQKKHQMALSWDPEDPVTAQIIQQLNSIKSTFVRSVAPDREKLCVPKQLNYYQKMTIEEFDNSFNPIYRYKKDKEGNVTNVPVWYCKLKGDSTVDWHTKFNYLQKTTDEDGQTHTELVEIPWHIVNKHRMLIVPRIYFKGAFANHQVDPSIQISMKDALILDIQESQQGLMTGDEAENLINKYGGRTDLGDMMANISFDAPPVATHNMMQPDVAPLGAMDAVAGGFAAGSELSPSVNQTYQQYQPSPAQQYQQPPAQQYQQPPAQAQQYQQPPVQQYQQQQPPGQPQQYQPQPGQPQQYQQQGSFLPGGQA